MEVTCFLPCRAGSQRVPHKNVRPFGNYSGGLLEIKLRQLAEVDEINSILLSTDDDCIIERVGKMAIPKVVVHRRAAWLASSETSTDDLIRHAGEVIQSGHILWTHVTSPFITPALYREIIRDYFSSLKEGFDSLMTVDLVRSFLWNEKGPINYNRAVEKWPRTQTLPPIYHINSGAFVASSEIYTQKKDRIGEKPRLFQLSDRAAFDIDWLENFEFGELMQKTGFASTGLSVLPGEEI